MAIIYALYLVGVLRFGGGQRIKPYFTTQIIIFIKTQAGLCFSTTHSRDKYFKNFKSSHSQELIKCCIKS